MQSIKMTIKQQRHRVSNTANIIAHLLSTSGSDYQLKCDKDYIEGRACIQVNERQMQLCAALWEATKTNRTHLFWLTLG